MKYYLIVGEASGDLHASRLMRSLKKEDKDAEFRFSGGDLMQAEGGTLVKHYRELAYMGFVPVLLHLRTIFKNMAFCKQDILAWCPDVVILVDYPGFNLDIAKFVHSLREKTDVPHPKVYYYISPKIWAWKEYRIKNIKRDVDELFSILPFEIPFFEEKHHFPIHYVGNPTADEVSLFRKVYTENFEQFCTRSFSSDVPRLPMIALLAGSRKQEIKDNLPTMVEAARTFSNDYQLVLACAPGIEESYYQQVLSRIPSYTSGDVDVRMVKNDTYALLSHASAALVTSGTATLETAFFDVPQVVCYKVPFPHLTRFAFRHIIKVDFISLVNLIVNKEIVQELLADRFSVSSVREELRKILPGSTAREEMLLAYRDVHEKLGDTVAPDNAARMMVQLLC